jgi:hypothetical protein
MVILAPIAIKVDTKITLLKKIHAKYDFKQIQFKKL